MFLILAPVRWTAWTFGVVAQAWRTGLAEGRQWYIGASDERFRL